MNDEARRLYQAFDVLPLKADTKDLRVDLDRCRGDAEGVVKKLHSQLVLAQRPVQLVLAGHRGSGKSTELFALKTRLESEAPRHFCVYCDLREEIDVNDVDFLDVLVGVLRRSVVDLQEREKINLKPAYFKDRVTRLYKALKSPVKLEGIKLPDMFGELAVTIKGSPDARAELRKVFEPDAGNWMVAANELIGEAVLKLSKKKYGGLVILVDDLDKIARRPMDAARCSLAENLFIHRAAQLTGLGCHVVYSMPLELAYSHHRPEISKWYGGTVTVLPMTRVQQRPPNEDDDPAGLQAFRDIIDKRIVHANSKFKTLFDSEGTRDEIVRLSGGQPFELMQLIRRGMARSLPIRADMIATLRAESARDYVWLREAHVTILKEAADGGQVARPDEGREKLIGELLESRALLQYLNGDEWYRPNPAIDLDHPA